MAWLLAYDIMDPKRWRKVYSIAKTNGFRVQYSLFWLPIDLKRQQIIELQLGEIIDPFRDDVRFYPLSDKAWAWLTGPCPWQEDVYHIFARRFSPYWYGDKPRY